MLALFEHTILNPRVALFPYSTDKFVIGEIVRGLLVILTSIVSEYVSE